MVRLTEEITPVLNDTSSFFDLIEIGDTLKLLSDVSILLNSLFNFSHLNPLLKQGPLLK